MKPNKAGQGRFSMMEMFISALLYVTFVSRCLYLVYKASLDKEDMLSFDLHPSWWFGRKMDDSDYEWRYWVDYYSNNLPWYLGHALLGLAINCHLEKGRIYVNIAFSLVSLSYILGIKQLTFLICNVCLVYLTVVLTRRKALVWAVSLMLLSLLNLQGTATFIMKLCYPDPTGTRYMMLVYAMSICNLRLVSLGIDMIDEFDRTDNVESFYRVLAYTLYLPTFFSGPFTSYRHYITKMSVKQDTLTWTRLKWFISESFLLLLWWSLMEISLHYFYSSALQQEEYFLVSADNMTVFGLCFVQAALFNLKYLVLYGVPTLFAELDGISMPPRPCCFLIKHTASAIWRFFDVGLYNFIIQYIYKPFGGSKLGLSQQVLTMFLCFVFIGFWHGTAANIFIWVLVNFLTMFMENMHKHLIQSRQWRNVVVQFGEDAAYRLEVLLMTPIGVVSLWSMFVFLGGRNVGFNLYKKILKNAHLELRVTVLLLSYCHIVFSRCLEDGSFLRCVRDLMRLKRRHSDANSSDINKKSKHKH
ncbi:protein-cysteine N-palmitoyltransferase HHAT-like [Watersipora subatra]|uniref:protein-cysteine N-palmitoyltransferase HHAT-like n=1 Tax=Watersipora subatra TaxID=2589382 RepID=UPI00355BEAB5